MSSSIRLIASLFFLQAIFTQAKESCRMDDDDETIVICNGEDISDLRSALTAVAEKPQNILFVEHTQVTKLEANTTTKKYVTLWMKDNKLLTIIDHKAFASSITSVTKLIIWNSPQLGDKIWEFTSAMSATQTIAFHGVRLTKVPAEAFKMMRSLSDVSFSENTIMSFEASLEGLNLESLNLRANNLNNNSFSENVFKGKLNIKTLNLSHNPEMTQLKKTQFKGLLKAGTIVYVGRWESNGFKYMECVGAEWLCEKKEGGAYFYHTVLGYECVEEGYTTIVDYCQRANKL